MQGIVRELFGSGKSLENNLQIHRIGRVAVKGFKYNTLPINPGLGDTVLVPSGSVDFES